jgi:hypothetical protein
VSGGPAGLAPIAGGSPEAHGLAPIAGGSPEADGLAPIAGGSPEADGRAVEADGAGDEVIVAGGAAWLDEVTFIALLFGAACVVFGIFPSPLLNLAAYAGRALFGIF